MGMIFVDAAAATVTFPVPDLMCLWRKQGGKTAISILFGSSVMSKSVVYVWKFCFFFPPHLCFSRKKPNTWYIKSDLFNNLVTLLMLIRIKLLSEATFRKAPCWNRNVNQKLPIIMSLNWYFPTLRLGGSDQCRVLLTLFHSHLLQSLDGIQPVQILSPFHLHF